jgi:hypothetical protein
MRIHAAFAAENLYEADRCYRPALLRKGKYTLPASLQGKRDDSQSFMSNVHYYRRLFIGREEPERPRYLI